MALLHETIPHGNGVFAKWQPVYAERGIATFPCTANKTPAVRNYGKFGLAASAAMRSRFPDANVDDQRYKLIVQTCDEAAGTAEAGCQR
jgi:hypothetical protein